MPDARRLYRFALIGGLLATALTLAAALNSLARLPLERPSLAELSGACGQLLPQSTLTGVAALCLTSLAVTVLLLAARSIHAELTEHRAAQEICMSAVHATLAGRAVRILGDPEPRAFCIGLIRPQIVVSTGAIEQLAAPELAAVIAHEAHHATRRDPLRLLTLRVLADALFFLPLARRVAQQHSIGIEIAADQAAIATAGTAPLARALLIFCADSAGVGISGERIDALSGRPRRRDLPLGLVAGALITLTALAGLSLWHGGGHPDADIGDEGANAAAGQTCLLVLLAVPLVVALIALLRAPPASGRPAT